MKDKKNIFVSLAYFFASSRKYQKIKSFFRDILENDQYPYKKYFDIFMITIILTSVTILVIDVRNHIPVWLDDFDLYFITFVFVVEYLLRLWVYSDIHKMLIEEYEESLFFDKKLSLFKVFGKIFKSKWQYISSLAAIVDLIAILPSYRGVRVLRVLILFRAFKMLRYAKSLTGFLFVLKNKKFELLTLLTLSAFFIFISGIMLYVFEGDNDNPNIHNLFDAFYWALVTISTVGYGDISPITTEGRVVSMLIIITGIGLISFFTSIIVSSFSERLSSLREDRVVQEIGKKQNLTVICGFGLLGRLVAQGFEKEGIDFVVIDLDEEKANLAYEKGYSAICTDATQSHTFERLGIQDSIASVLCLTSDDIQNAFIAINVKSLNENVYVAARCSDEEIAQKMKFAKVDQLIMPEKIASMMGSVYAGEPAAFEVLLSIVEEKAKTQIDEIVVTKNNFMDSKSIKEINFNKYRIILLGVFQKAHTQGSIGEFIFNPEDDFILNAGDKLICIGYVSAIANIKRKA
ncbi:ion transporter [Sulfurimonas sp.]|uniref:ion transporter n=1 Tax=Sulfurimonas sp. TaxID=2022749 RepID=UPI002609E54E|nr:ion transporter [Sulfurimonas sp.]